MHLNDNCAMLNSFDIELIRNENPNQVQGNYNVNYAAVRPSSGNVLLDMVIG